MALVRTDVRSYTRPRHAVTVLVTVPDIPVSVSMHEVFANAPLQLVVFEVRYERLAKVGRELFDALSAVVTDGEVDFATANVRVDQPASPEAALFHIVDRAGTLAITMWPSSMVVESTDYLHFSPFRQIALEAFTALSHHLGDHRVSRIGLRYVDEIHPDPSPRRPEEWSRWIRADLTALTGITKLPIVGFGGGLTIDIGGDCNLSFRYTTVPGPAVESAGLLRLRPRPASPAVVLDTDGYWQPPQPAALDPDDLAAVVNRIHDAVTGVFEQVITEDSRMLFRAVDQGEA